MAFVVTPVSTFLNNAMFSEMIISDDVRGRHPVPWIKQRPWRTWTAHIRITEIEAAAHEGSGRIPMTIIIPIPIHNAPENLMEVKNTISSQTVTIDRQAPREPKRNYLASIISRTSAYDTDDIQLTTQRILDDYNRHVSREKYVTETQRPLHAPADQHLPVTATVLTKFNVSYHIDQQSVIDAILLQSPDDLSNNVFSVIDEYIASTPAFYDQNGQKLPVLYLLAIHWTICRRLAYNKLDYDLLVKKARESAPEESKSLPDIDTFYSRLEWSIPLEYATSNTNQYIAMVEPCGDTCKHISTIPGNEPNLSHPSTAVDLYYPCNFYARTSVNEPVRVIEKGSTFLSYDVDHWYDNISFAKMDCCKKKFFSLQNAVVTVTVPLSPNAAVTYQPITDVCIEPAIQYISSPQHGEYAFRVDMDDRIFAAVKKKGYGNRLSRFQDSMRGLPVVESFLPRPPPSADGIEREYGFIVSTDTGRVRLVIPTSRITHSRCFKFSLLQSIVNSYDSNAMDCMLDMLDATYVVERTIESISDRDERLLAAVLYQQENTNGDTTSMLHGSYLTFGNDASYSC